MAVRVTQVELIGLLIQYAGKRTVDSLMPGLGTWVEPFTEIDNAGSRAGFGGDEGYSLALFVCYV